MRKALSRTRRRLRQIHGFAGFSLGLAIGCAAAFALMALSFFLPLENRGRLLPFCAAFPALGGFLGYMLPVGDARAARAADACGLLERAQTALALTDRQDQMACLQRADAVRALEALDVRKAMPLRPSRRILLAAGVCALLAAALCFVPNPQDDVLRQRAQLRQRMEKPAQAVEQAAGQLEEEILGEETVQDLRRLLGDLARDLRQAKDSRDALTSVAGVRQRMEKQLSGSRDAAADALGAAGLESLAAAMEAGDTQSLEEAIQEALGTGEAGLSGEQMEQAAEAASSDAAASAALQAAARAMARGDSAAAAQALSQLSASRVASGQVEAALQSARAMAGGQGQGESQGNGQGSGTGQGASQGKTNGSGAGQGSTNQDAGSVSSFHSAKPL